MILGGRNATLAERLWSRVEKLPSGCWEWQGYRMPFGYGQIGLGRTTITTHRAAWLVTYGVIPHGLMVRHRCDNPPCCNPAHLVLGTAQDNSEDAVTRGRTAKGARLPQTILTDEAVRAIRSRYERFTMPGVRGYRTNRNELAAEFGVCAKYISAIVHGRERAGV